MIESATEGDLPEIRAVLERLHLPLAGVDEHLPTMLVAREGEQRSFPGFGFEQITRDREPPPVRESVEFHSACPASAVVMRKQLR
jgi:N-acetylglutamate synthase-like GNAT family acetyltransferase